MTDFIFCRPRCFTCQEPLPDGIEEGWCSDVCERTVPVLRWACTCGRFIAEDSIQSRDRLDPGSYYGVSTDTSYTCSRCGVVDAEPHLIQIGTAVAPA